MSRRSYVETVCRTCRADLIVGLDGDVAAVSAVTDAVDLTRTGELLAVVDGRRTYEVIGSRLHRRDRWALVRPAGRVLAEHRCRDLIPAGWRRPPTPKVIHRPTESEEGIPF